MLPPGRNKVGGRIRPEGLVFATCALGDLPVPSVVSKELGGVSSKDRSDI